jgi:hypothetical protein
MRIVHEAEQCIGYKLNLIGIRVYREHCQLVARIDGTWLPIGPPRKLPFLVPAELSEAGSDALLGTACQYKREHPATDLADLLAGRKTFDGALRDMAPL